MTPENDARHGMGEKNLGATASAASDERPVMTAAKRLSDAAQRVYKTHAERAAMRCALGDAASLCDVIVRDIASAHRGRGGKGAVTKLGNELAAIARRCGDEIWQMREKIRVSR